MVDIPSLSRNLIGLLQLIFFCHIYHFHDLEKYMTLKISHYFATLSHKRQTTDTHTKKVPKLSSYLTKTALYISSIYCSSWSSCTYTCI